MNLSFLFDELSRSELYPHPVEVITTIETHISIVFLTGEFAYKLKKPVDFGFLDFTSLAERKRFCELEINLNRRTAPDLYLDVCPLYCKEGHLQFTPYGDPVEYVIKMAQFDPNLVLGRYLKDHTLSPSQIKLLTENIATFHVSAEKVSTDLAFGHPDNVIHPMLDNFPSLLKTFTHPEQQYRLRQLADWTLFTQKTLFDALLDRKENGDIRACHGDMHLDNITLLNEKPTLFDGIEFNEQFRWIDVMNDLAFLMIDLENRQQLKLKRQLLSYYINLTGDYTGLNLLKFYQVYRSMVRAKITALRYHQLEKNSREADHYYALALTYLKQAEDTAYELPEPKLILMQGVSGSGKSHYAQQILGQIDAIIISSDIERKRLFGISPLERVSKSEQKRLYSADMNHRTYQKLLTLAETTLASGYSVIIDATFLKEEHRRPFQQLANKHTYDFYVFAINHHNYLTPIEDGLAERSQTNDNPSDADISVMRRQLKNHEPPQYEPEHMLTIVPKQELSDEILKNWLNLPL
ncbi:AAA family ATPase [Hydrogenovibrio sp. 3SP14C1]|uniref:bifunctional aminoglycoside phosphotransferase/ATP-binding protein n=1 Tax=Hydrogenovibrio sp. 3SP14C1 TaxID=3038774 RepID=UPI002416470E|nr:bifunctional aminoglycoside phosphotransferase/ATP-binding protein [Hydrogenovibrio sp. 3SP14C1]MDG4812805.1 AAA family ATPase [Hydrogenovibrio sp. 3SP14C1]